MHAFRQFASISEHFSFDGFILFFFYYTFEYYGLWTLTTDGTWLVDTAIILQHTTCLHTPCSVHPYRHRHFRLNSTWKSYVLLFSIFFCFVSFHLCAFSSVSTSTSTTFCSQSYGGVSCECVCVCRRSVYITQSHRLLYDGELNMPANCAIIPIWYIEKCIICLSARSHSIRSFVRDVVFFFRHRI